QARALPSAYQRDHGLNPLGRRLSGGAGVAAKGLPAFVGCPHFLAIHARGHLVGPARLGGPGVRPVRAGPRQAAAGGPALQAPSERAAAAVAAGRTSAGATPSRANSGLTQVPD